MEKIIKLIVIIMSKNFFFVKDDLSKNKLNQL